MTSLPELESLGLGRYSELFAAHGIGVDVLADLTDGDLEKLGLAIGDRRRILKAAQNMRTVEAPAASTPSNTRTAERRHLTVMFVDLVGSTALSGGSIPRRWGMS
jgi:class 3 adenylate cyclase